MLGYAERGEARPTHTDEGIKIASFAHNGTAEIVEIACRNLTDRIDHTPAVMIDGVEFVYDGTDSHQQTLVFRSTEVEVDDGVASPATPVGHDDGFGTEA